VDGRDVLQRLVSLPVQRWNFASEGASVVHMGPMAQDFSAVFAVGADNTHIATVDADGVALAAIQGLYGMVRERDARIGALEHRLVAVEAAQQQDTTAAGFAPFGNGWLLPLLAGVGAGGVLVAGGLVGGILLAPRLRKPAGR
jgi:hypothetical protein